MDKFLLNIKFNTKDSEFVDLKELFGRFMSCSNEVAIEQLRRMVDRLEQIKKSSLTSFSVDYPLEDLLLRLYEQYPDDVGVFCPLLMNYLKLKEGESFFIAANVPHAYLSGDCIECMALSDNVVRAGLTPKFKDVETLCAMLDYR
jgi:mannose-6-phosphate isomerase